MIKVSVIVPIYNAEKYLDKCLNSLANQTLNDIEIILLNDGSTDNSHKIIDEYERNYSKKIKAIHNENHGIGYTRNIGIDLAKGKYISFVDSDDYLDLDNLEKMYNYAEENKLDLVICDLKKFDINNDVIGYERTENLEITNLENNPELLLDINLGPINKLFSTKLFKDKKNRFSETLKYEDMAILPKLIGISKKIGRVDNTYYNYLVHPNSETTTMDKRVFDILEILKIVNKDLQELKYYEEIKEYVEYLNIRTLFRYTLQQKKQKSRKLKNEFINKSFEYLNSSFPNWEKNKLLKKEPSYKRIIKESKFLTKIYVNF